MGPPITGVELASCARSPWPISVLEHPIHLRARLRCRRPGLRRRGEMRGLDDDDRLRAQRPLADRIPACSAARCRRACRSASPPRPSRARSPRHRKSPHRRRPARRARSPRSPCRGAARSCRPRGSAVLRRAGRGLESDRALEQGRHGLELHARPRASRREMHRARVPEARPLMHELVVGRLHESLHVEPELVGLELVALHLADLQVAIVHRRSARDVAEPGACSVKLVPGTSSLSTGGWSRPVTCRRSCPAGGRRR